MFPIVVPILRNANPYLVPAVRVYDVGKPPADASTRLYAVLTAAKFPVLLAVRATSVAVVPSKVYSPNLENVSPEDATLLLYIVIVVIVFVTSGVKNVIHILPDCTVAIAAASIDGNTSTAVPSPPSHSSRYEMVGMVLLRRASLSVPVRSEARPLVATVAKPVTADEAIDAAVVRTPDVVVTTI